MLSSLVLFQHLIVCKAPYRKTPSTFYPGQRSKNEEARNERQKTNIYQRKDNAHDNHDNNNNKDKGSPSSALRPPGKRPSQAHTQRRLGSGDPRRVAVAPQLAGDTGVQIGDCIGVYISRNHPLASCGVDPSFVRRKSPSTHRKPPRPPRRTRATSPSRITPLFADSLGLHQRPRESPAMHKSLHLIWPRS